LVIIGLVVLVARDAITRIPGSLPDTGQMLMIATGLALLLTILATFIKPSPGLDIVGSIGAVPQLLPRFTFSVGFSYGGFVAIVAAAVAFAAAFGTARPLNSPRLTLPTARRRPGPSAG
jgi:hypothetical protein